MNGQFEASCTALETAKETLWMCVEGAQNPDGGGGELGPSETLRVGAGAAEASGGPAQHLVFGICRQVLPGGWG